MHCRWVRNTEAHTTEPQFVCNTGIAALVYWVLAPAARRDSLSHRRAPDSLGQRAPRTNRLDLDSKGVYEFYEQRQKNEHPAAFTDSGRW